MSNHLVTHCSMYSGTLCLRLSA